jgi:hypothetical protein
VGVELSPRRIAEHQAALVDFNNAYVEYLEGGPNASNDEALRNRVLVLIPRAHAAFNAAGTRPYVASPPVAPRQVVYDNLASMVFLHEQGFGMYTDVPQLILDSVRMTAATLTEKRAELERKRRRPVYWLD